MEIRGVVTLDDNNKYAIVSKIDYEEKKYYYLVDINNVENLMFCYEDKGDLVKLNDAELIKKMLPLFLDASKDIIKKIQQTY